MPRPPSVVARRQAVVTERVHALAGGAYTRLMLQTVPRFDRLTVEADKLGGQVCIRGYRFTVEHLLELLAADWDLERIQLDFPFVEHEDVRQALGYAAALAHREVYVPLQEPA
jgi:uncharacterized protein (DUF433 family)